LAIGPIGAKFVGVSAFRWSYVSSSMVDIGFSCDFFGGSGGIVGFLRL
jgi:hypothetical protein